jgi:hypothetical protein
MFDDESKSEIRITKPETRKVFNLNSHFEF